MKQHNASTRWGIYLSLLNLFTIHLFTAYSAPLKWVCNWPDTTAQTFALYQGETASFQPLFRAYGLARTNAAIEAVWYQTNGMGNVWWKLDGNTFAPSNDVGAAAYRFFVQARDEGDTVYRANGTLRMLPSPGFVPNIVSPPVAALDFSTIDVSNAPWPAEIAAATEGLVNSDGVKNIVTNEIDLGFSEWVWDDWQGDFIYVSGPWHDEEYDLDEHQYVSYWFVRVRGPEGNHTFQTIQGPNATNLVFTAIIQGQSFSATARRRHLTRNALALARLEDLNAATNAVAAAIDRSVAVAAQSATNYTDSTASSLYPKSQGETLATQVAAIGAVLNGEDARFVVTNYDSVVHTPEAYVEINVSNNWLQVWREGNRWEKHEAETHTWKTNMEAEVSHKADRAWGAYDSETGGYAPDGFTQISSSNILVAAGMAYQRQVTSDGSIWVLQCNSGVASIGGDTNGFFRVLDGDGETQFEIVQGDKRVIGADADGISVSGSTCTITYSVIADSHPILEITGDLQTPNWKAETDDDCIATVDWSGTSGAYVAMVQRKSAGASLFVKASYMAGGETYIRNVAPVSVQGGILCTDGVHKVRPVYNNGSITWEVVQ